MKGGASTANRADEGAFSRGENGEIVLSDRVAGEQDAGADGQSMPSNQPPVDTRSQPVRELDLFNSFLGQFCNK